MANRVLQQKRLKMKRMRRAWAKPFSMRNTGPFKHPMYINDQGEPVDVSFASRAKAGKMFVDEHLLAKYRFNPNSSEAIYARTRGLHSDLAVDKEVILAKIVQSRGNAGSLQGEKRFVYKIMHKEPNWEVRLYMCGDECFFCEEMLTTTHKVSKISFQYDDRHRAVDAWKHNRIVWDKVERIPLSPPQADPDTTGD